MQPIPSKDIAVAEETFQDALSKGKMDQDILPLVAELKTLSPYVYPCQSCSGHTPYKGKHVTYAMGNGVFTSYIDIPKNLRPKNASKYWGYVACFVSAEIYQWILRNQNRLLTEYPWIISSLSCPQSENIFMFAFDRRNFLRVERELPKLFRKIIIDIGAST